ncbi:hypothetical protein [Defluviitalea raffinosedens]|uniref:hypothetical protein n=1 Tax=Defluviitalea raffinosedens TaxID=1450156 RepID=UPI00195DDD07|nr:hypothetical protein [Defluviitalea raffinosedens]
MTLINYEDWELEFDFNQEIINIDNAQILKVGDHKYIIKGIDSSSYFYTGESRRVVFKSKFDEDIKFLSFL